ncbi:MAG: hypothetical protein ACOH2H_15205 [Cypionkella sp.]
MKGDNALQTTTAARRSATVARAWTYALRAGVFGYAELSAELSISMEAARDIIQAWIAEGRTKVRSGGSQAGRKMFELTQAYREPTDRTSKVAQQMWTAMRGLKTFTPVDLQAHCVPDLRVDLVEANTYAQALLRGGYLNVVRTAVPGVRDATYKLIRNTGPRAPREKRVQAIWDPNDAAYSFISGMGRIGRAK